MHTSVSQDKRNQPANWKGEMFTFYYLKDYQKEGTITVYDNASAASGTALFIIPAATAVGQYSFPVGVITTAGAYADFASTGTVNFLVAPSV